MKVTGIGLVLMGIAIGVFYLVAAAAAPSSGAGGSVVMPVSAAAAILAGAALLAFGGAGYRKSAVLTPADRGSPGRSQWW